jgi:hypothetical protein
MSTKPDYRALTGGFRYCERLPAERELAVGRPCLECGEPVDPDDLESIEQHLHETGLPGRIWGAARACGGPKLSTRADFVGSADG